MVILIFSSDLHDICALIVRVCILEVLLVRSELSLGDTGLLSDTRLRAGTGLRSDTLRYWATPTDWALLLNWSMLAEALSYAKGCDHVHILPMD